MAVEREREAALNRREQRSRRVERDELLGEGEVDRRQAALHNAHPLINEANDTSRL